MLSCLFEPFLMEQNSGNSTGLEWENLVLHSMCSSPGNGLYGQNYGSDSSSKNPTSASEEFIPKTAIDGFGNVASLPLHKSTNEDILGMQKMSRSISTSLASVCSSEQTIGLNLGRKMQHDDVIPPSSPKTSVSSFPMPTSMTKRSRTSYQSTQNSSCQVEGCDLDLTSAKDYHRRHRICESHSKSPKVIVAGMERRFCQQCSRFHELLEFDDKKRSCRRRLSDHNARRRRVQPNQSIHLSSAGFSASFDPRPIDFPISISNPTWEIPTTSVPTSQARYSRAEGSRGVPCFSTDDFSYSISGLKVNSERLSSIHCSSPQVLDQCSRVPATDFPIPTSLPSTHSLLSTNSWCLNESKSIPDPHHNELFHSNQIQLEEGPHFGSIHAINLHNAVTTQLQEFQLFQVPF